jgi:gas vesicle protein
MAQEPDELRAQIDQQRDEISGTIDQIENRINPSHVLARRQDRVKRRLTGWKDSVFGNDEPDYPTYRDPYGASYSSARDDSGGVGQRVGDIASSASDVVQHAPSAVRRQTRGNPMAAGAIALGAGWLIGSLLPESGTERRAVRRIEPQLSDAAATVKQEGKALADDLKEPAKQAAHEVKQAGQDAATEIKDHSTQAAHDVKDATGS